MRILITNDDGINAPGLAVLETIAANVAGPDGDVFVVAPAFEQSGVSHCINYSHPTLLSELGPKRFAAEGSPADCVLAGIHEVMKDQKPDLVLSGVNRGNNSAENVVYSGTVGGAMEGALQGVRSIALSQFYGPGNIGLDDQFEAAAAFGADVVQGLLAHGVWKNGDYDVFYNVNFPPVPAKDVKGQRVVAQGWRQDTNFSVAPHTAPSGRMFMWVTGGPQHLPTAPGTDVAANVDGYISITPLTADLTLHGALAPLAAALDRDTDRS
ncbi:MAG: 5'/3'-nucleotidase SurE [Pseudomonadota bacterium]